MKNVKIQIEHTCEHCENGIIQNPIWAEYYQDVKDGKVNDDSEPEVIKWFEQSGYLQGNEKYYDIPEEIDCSECEGTTLLYKKISLEDLRELLKIDDDFAALGSHVDSLIS